MAKKIKDIEPQYAMVSLTVITADAARNTRQWYDPAGIKDLAADIKKRGLINPPEVTPDPEKAGQYRLEMGYRRYLALKEIDPEGQVRVQVLPADTTDLELFLRNTSENEKRQDLTTYEKALACQRGVSDHELSHTLAGKQVGLSKASSVNYCSILNGLHPKILKVWSDPSHQAHGLCTVNTLQPLAQLDKAEQWEEWQIMTGDKEAPAPDPDPNPSPDPKKAPSEKATTSQVKKALAAAKKARQNQAVAVLSWVLEGKDKPLKVGRKIVFDPAAAADEGNGES